MVEAGILEAKAGKVRLLKREELPDDYLPFTDNRQTVWEGCQHLIKRLEGGSEEEAARLAKQLGYQADMARDLAYRLYQICERNKWAEEARAYNGLIEFLARDHQDPRHPPRRDHARPRPGRACGMMARPWEGAACLRLRSGRTEALVPDELLDAVVAHFDPLRVILFGSRARGEAGADSDIDLLVVLDDDAPAEKLGWRSAFEARKDFHQAVDIVPCRRRWFEDKREAIGSLAHMAAEDGLVVYERG